MASNHNFQRCWGWQKFCLPVFLAVIFNFSGIAPVRANLTIVPTWDSTITSDPNARSITNTILQVIALYHASFSDPVTATITFQETGGGLGANLAQYNHGISYPSIRAKLVANATTANDKIALAHLPNTATNPVNNSTTMELTLPHGRLASLDELELARASRMERSC